MNTTNNSNSNIVSVSGHCGTYSIGAGGNPFGYISSVIIKDNESNILSRQRSESADLPAIIFHSTNLETREEIVLTLKPEIGISTQETLKLTMMLIAYNRDPNSFNALAFVKKNNLERHFTYA